jgi:hypothetical protein
LRYRVTADGALVDFSVFGALEVGYASSSTEIGLTSAPLGSSGVSEGIYSHVVGGGLIAGLSAERALLEQLSIRLSATLFNADVSKGSSQTSFPGTTPLPGLSTENTANISNRHVTLTVQPAVELRLYF